MTAVPIYLPIKIYNLMVPKSKLLKTFCFSHAHNSQPIIESRKPYAGLGKTMVGNKLKKEQNLKK
jgi:hypothetical protein